MRSTAAVLLLCCLSCFATPPKQYDSLAVMLAQKPITGETVLVGTAGGLRAFKNVQSITGTTNIGNTFAAVGGGYWEALDKAAPVQDPRWFGAVCDNSTDDSVAVQAAIDYCQLSGAKLLFPAGRSIAENLLVRTHLSTNSPYRQTRQLVIEGLTPAGAKYEDNATESEGRSVLKLKSGSTNSLLVAQVNAPVTIRNMTFDGATSGTVSSGVPLIDLQGTSYDESALENVLVTRSPGDGIYVTRDEVRMVNVRALDNVGSGIHFYNTADHTLNYMLSGFNGGHGILADTVGYIRGSHWDVYQNVETGITITNSVYCRLSNIQSDDNYKHGAQLSITDGRFENSTFLRNNIAQITGKAANPDPDGTYDEVELTGLYQNMVFVNTTFGDTGSRTGKPAYLLDDQRYFLEVTQGVGVALIGCTLSTGSAGFTVDRWRPWTEKRTVMTGIYDMSTGRVLNNPGDRQEALTFNTNYPSGYVVNRADRFLILSGTNRTIVLPNPTNVYDGWRITFVDASGTAHTNAINVTVTNSYGTVNGYVTKPFYDTSGIFTLVKSGANYGIETVGNDDHLVQSDAAYQLSALNGPRLKLFAGSDSDNTGVALKLHAYNTGTNQFGRIQMVRGGGTKLIPLRTPANSSLFQLTFAGHNDNNAAQTADMAGIMAYTTDAPSTTNIPSNLYFWTTTSNDISGTRTRYMSLDYNGAVAIADDGFATTANTNALLDLRSTKRTLYPPRMTTTQRNAITMVESGGIIYNTTEDKLQCYQKGAWVNLQPLDANGPGITTGSGSPEGAVTAVGGSLYLRIDAGTGAALYVKETGIGNTGWVAK